MKRERKMKNREGKANPKVRKLIAKNERDAKKKQNERNKKII